MAVTLPAALPRTEGLPDATPIGPEMSTGEDHGCPIAALLAHISLTAVPFGDAFWYQTLVKFPAASSATVPWYALVARVACVDHDAAEPLKGKANGTASTRLAKLLQFIESPLPMARFRLPGLELRKQEAENRQARNRTLIA
jgi:hypothetical protein